MPSGRRPIKCPASSSNATELNARYQIPTGPQLPAGYNRGSDLHIDGNERDLFIEAMKQTPMESVPGGRYRYTNAGYSVLATVVEKVTAQPGEATSSLRSGSARPSSRDCCTIDAAA